MLRYRMRESWARFGLADASERIVCLLETVIRCKVVDAFVETAAKGQGSDLRA